MRTCPGAPDDPDASQAGNVGFDNLVCAADIVQPGPWSVASGRLRQIGAAVLRRRFRRPLAGHVGNTL